MTLKTLSHITYLLLIIFAIIFGFFGLPYTFHIVIILVIIIIVLKVVTFYSFQKTWTDDLILVLSKRRSIKLKDVLGLVAFIGLIIAASYFDEYINAPSSDSLLVFHLVLWAYFIIDFRQHQYDRVYYLTNKGVIAGINLQPQMLWVEVNDYDIDYQNGAIKFDRKGKRPFKIKTDEKALIRKREKVERFLADKKLLKS